MASTVNTNSLATLAELRRYLALSADDTEFDGVLVALINHFADYAEQYTGRSLKEKTHTNVLVDGSGLDELFLPNWPVDRTQTFTVNEDAARTFDTGTLLILWNESGNITSADFMLDDESGELTRLNACWPSGKKTIKVTYTAGLTATDAGYSVLLQAYYRQVSKWFNEIGRDPALTSMSEAGVQAGLIAGTGPFSARSAILLPEVRDALDSERRPTL